MDEGGTGVGLYHLCAVLTMFSFGTTRMSSHISKPVVTCYDLVRHFLIPVLLFAGGHHILKREDVFLLRSSTLLLTLHWHSRQLGGDLFCLPHTPKASK